MDNLNSTQHYKETEDRPSRRFKSFAFLDMFIPREGYFITPILIIANISIFLLMIISGVHFMIPESEDLVLWGANYRPITLSGEVWRLVSCCFLHIGVIHLALNMYALVNIGLLLEPILGRLKFTLLYFLTGIAASTTSLWWHDNTVSAGASGAIFGLYGIFTGLLTTNLIDKEQRQSQLKSLVIFIGYNLMFGLQGGIDNAAHIGGLLSGFGLSYISYYGLMRSEDIKLQKKLMGASVLLVLTYAVTVIFLLPADTQKYYSALEEFSKIEDKAMTFYKIPDSSENRIYIEKIVEGIKDWEKASEVLKECDKLDLPKNIKEKNKLIQSYVDFRIKSYKLYEKAYKENTSQYNEEIELYNEKIDSRIKEIENFK